MVASAAVSRLQPWKFAIFVARYVRFCTAVNRVDAAVNPALFLEYEEVLKRPDLFPGEIAHADRLLDRIARVSRLVTNLPSGRPRLRDPDDEMVLDAALDSGASAIVTFNKADFRPTGPKLGLSLLAPGEFLRTLR